MDLSVEHFAAFHAAVHDGKAPFGWQQRLLQQIVSERSWPSVLDLPTGSGKTTCIDIALFALALDAAAGDATTTWCPRRIAMVVDRRIVVDQVAERGRRLARALADPAGNPVVLAVAERLRGLSRKREQAVGVYTLRGGMPRDDGWARTPDQPLILASTVDQIGSRLLMQGYGVSDGMRPVHAGLLGNDTLLLLDEVHLSQPFAETLEQLGRIRHRFAIQGVSTRFHAAFLSATPLAGEASRFELRGEDKDPGSALAKRLQVTKPARLVDATDEPKCRAQLERRCAEEAAAICARHRTVAVVLNRVASAREVASLLRRALPESTDVVLLTGRMRPLDRDDAVAALRQRVITGRTRREDDRPLVVVATQCIEAGADFDFDAIVTEAASLDALRQRFGRVDRLGLYENAEGVIVVPLTQDKGKPKVLDDAVYGAALPQTCKWLRKNLKKPKRSAAGDRTPFLDFGVSALPVVAQGKIGALVAAQRHAPVLLPAYLDLWLQTSPRPSVLPDVSLFLHGAEGVADVQVVWRADLDDRLLAPGREDDAIDVVASIPASSLEAMSIPFVAAQRWLQSSRALADFPDVEGVPTDQRQEDGQQRRVVVWRGERSEVASTFAPGSTIVVPTSYGGVRDGTFDPLARETVQDLAERAAFLARGVPMLRLHPDVLAGLKLQLALDDDLALVRRALTAAAVSEPTPWRKAWLQGVAKWRAKTLVAVDEEPWLVLRGRRRTARDLQALLRTDTAAEGGLGVTSDEDVSSHTGSRVTLAEHTRGVERLAHAYATAAGLPQTLIDDITLAAFVHDIGKADERFQLLLRGGSEIEFLKDSTVWAKSGMDPTDRHAHRRAARLSGYPRGARHELQSVTMLSASPAGPHAVLAQATDPDLLLHLVASHHGQCRPFAPVVADVPGVEVRLAHHQRAKTAHQFAGHSSHALHRLDSPIADRFWRSAERYGWLELCWLEALLRLADHRASEEEQEAGDADA